MLPFSFLLQNVLVIFSYDLQLKCNLRFGSKRKVVVGRLGRYLNNFDADESAHGDDDEIGEKDRDDADVADDNDGDGSGPVIGKKT